MDELKYDRPCIHNVMDALIELVHLLTRNKLKSIDILDLTEGGDSKLVALYDVISEGKVLNDKEAVELLYPDADSTSGYRKLKSKLQRKLVSSLLLADLNKSSYSNRKSAYILCYKEWAAVRILIAKDAWAACTEIAERILKYTIKYEFTELTLDLLSILRFYYGIHLGNLTRFEEYKELFDKYELLYVAENKAESLYTELVVHYINDKSKKSDFSKKAEMAFNEILHSLQQYSSYRLHFYGGMIRLMISSTVNDHEETIKTCKDIIRFFKQKPYKTEIPLQAAYYQELVSHCQLRQFELGRTAANQGLALTEEGTINWFKYYEMYFILAMHTGNYSEALHIYQRVHTHRHFDTLPSSSIELWQIYEAYLHLLAEFGYLSRIETEAILKKFSLSRFLNEISIYTKDKSGLNIAIIIFQICYLLAKGERDKIIDREEAIEKYCRRHLNEEHALRSFYFIRALLAIITANSLDEYKIHKAQMLKEKTFETENMGASQALQFEVIPYKELWAMIVKALNGL